MRKEQRIKEVYIVGRRIGESHWSHGIKRLLIAGPTTVHHAHSFMYCIWLYLTVVR